MRPLHIGLALLVAAIWGFNFVVIKVALESFPPLLLTALRFIVAGLPALLLVRPMPWRRLIPIGLTLFVGQFAFLFSAMAVGMPPGLASASLQAQAFFTVLIAAVTLGERPSGRQLNGIALAFAGLAAIAGTIGGDLTAWGFALTMASAFSWGTGNVLLRRWGAGIDVLPLMVWLSVIPPLPALALSLAAEGPDTIIAALTTATALGWAALLYIAVGATLAGFGIWGFLMKRYPAGVVAPFSLLVPVFGIGSAALLVGEQFGPQRFAGMALILLGLAVVALRLPRRS